MDRPFVSGYSWEKHLERIIFSHFNSPLTSLEISLGLCLSKFAHLALYVYFAFQLPDEMQKYTRLLKSCGIKEKCDLISALQLISQCHSGSVQKNQAQTAQDDLNLSIRILHELKSTELSGEDRERLLIPIHRWDVKCLERYLGNCFCQFWWPCTSHKDHKECGLCT